MKLMMMNNKKKNLPEEVRRRFLAERIADVLMADPVAALIRQLRAEGVTEEEVAAALRSDRFASLADYCKVSFHNRFRDAVPVNNKRLD